MSRPAGEPLTSVHLRIPDIDLETLRKCHPSGYQTKIKELIRAYCVQLRERMEGATDV